MKKSWTPLTPISRQFKVGRNQKAEVLRTQLPLTPAAAKTIHRSQGDALDKLAIDLDGKKMPQIHYVGLSRVKSLDQLYILNLNEDKISLSKDVQQHMDTLRRHVYKPSLTFLYNLKDQCKIVCLNTQSLHRHLPDVTADHNLQAADLAIYTETRFCKHDTEESTEIAGKYQFINYGSSNNPQTRPPHGTAVYSTSPFKTNYPKICSSSQVEITSIHVQGKLQNITVVAVYNPPRTSVKTLCQVLKDSLPCTSTENLIVLGDFNINWLQETSSKRRLHNLMLSLGLTEQIKQYTTDNQTQIDLIFSNLEPQIFHCGVLETYWSYHKAVWIAIDI